MANQHERDTSGIQPVDPTRGGTGRSDGSLASEPNVEPADFSELQDFLDGLEYPASSEELVDHARKQFAPLAVLDQLEQLPPRTFNGTNEIRGVLEQILNERRGRNT